MSRMQRISLRASAGTGKTYSLVDRYCELLGVRHQDGGAPDQLRDDGGREETLRPEEIIAVTFTRKAAAELRERLRGRLYDAGRPDLAERIDGSCIGTVHSVCLRLLQEYALEAGLTPSASELTGEESDELFQQAVTMLEAESGTARGMTGRRLSELFSRFGLDREQFGEDARPAETLWIDTCRALIALARTNGVEDRLAAFGEVSWQDMAAMLDKFGPVRDDFEECRSRLQRVCRLQSRLELYRRTGRGKDETGERKYSNAVKAHVAAMKSVHVGRNWKSWFDLLQTQDLALLEDHPENMERDGTQQEMREAVLPVFCLRQFREDLRSLVCGLFEFSAAVMDRYGTLKQQAGGVDFADMERNACTALENDLVRRRMRGRFRALFVDEFQDSSPIQLHIFGQLAAVMEEGGKSCRLVCVGDSKQSIYGFRGAAPGLTETVTSSEGWRNAAPLDTCYRSHPEIVGFVNDFFSGLGTESARRLLRREENGRLDIRAGRSQQKAAEEQAADCAAHDGKWDAPLRFWTVGGGREDLQNDELALRIHGLLCEGVHVPLKDGRGLHPLQAGHIAVLCRTRDHGEALAAALEKRGIHACMARRGLLEQPHIRFCLAAFRVACSYGKDTLALTEMASFLGKDWAAMAHVDRLEGMAEKFSSVCRRLRVLTPAELLDAVLEVSDAFRLMAGSRSPFEVLADVEALRTLAAEYEGVMRGSRAEATPAGWLDWLEKQNPRRAAGGRDAVNIWTYHESKGLESPVVILYDLHRAPRPGTLWGLHAEGGTQAENLLKGRIVRWLPDVLTRVTPEMCPEFCEYIRDRQKTADEAVRDEELRLLYVGMTRARSMLVLTGVRPKPKKHPDRDGQQAVMRVDALKTCLPVPEGDHAEIHPRLAELQSFFTLGETGRLPFFGHSFLFQKTPEGVADRFDTKEVPVRLPVCRSCFHAQPEGPVWAEPAGFRTVLSRKKIAADGIRGNRRELGNMLHAWFALEFGAPARSEEREARLRDFCSLWRTDELWPDAPSYLYRFSDSLRTQVKILAGEHESLEWRTEEVLSVHEKCGDGCSRSVELRVDLLVRVCRKGKNDLWFIIDHKCGDVHGMDQAELRTELAREYGDQMGGYIRALRIMGRECRCWVYLPLEGRMLEFALIGED